MLFPSCMYIDRYTYVTIYMYMYVYSQNLFLHLALLLFPAVAVLHHNVLQNLLHAVLLSDPACKNMYSFVCVL